MIDTLKFKNIKNKIHSSAWHFFGISFKYNKQSLKLVGPNCIKIKQKNKQNSNVQQKKEINIKTKNVQSDIPQNSQYNFKLLLVNERKFPEKFS
jgi:hypothetical protein